MIVEFIGTPGAGKTTLLSLILADHRLPGRDGVDLLVELHRQPDTAVIKKVLVTGQADQQDTIRAVNEAGLDGQYIRRIQIHEDHTTLELPEGMPRDIERILKKAWVCGKQLGIRSLEPKQDRGKKRVFKAPARDAKAKKKPRKQKKS